MITLTKNRKSVQGGSRSRSGFARSLNLWFSRYFVFTVRTRLETYRKMADFLRAGMAIKDIINTLHDEYSNHKDARRVVFEDLRDQINQGRSIDQALRYWATPGEVSMISASSVAGNPEEGLENAARATESVLEMKSSLRRQLTYPVLLILLAGALIYIFSVQGIPAMADILPPEEWPGASRALYELAMFVQSYGHWVVIGVVGFITMVTLSLPRLRGPLRRALDRVPPWSTYRSVQSSMMLISVASMMQSGIPFTQALQNLRELSSPYVRRHIQRIEERSKGGESAGRAMDTEFFTREVRTDLAVYSSIAAIDSQLNRLGESAIKDSLAKISGGAKALNTLVLIGIAGYLIWVLYTFSLLNQALGNMATSGV